MASRRFVLGSSLVLVGLIGCGGGGPETTSTASTTEGVGGAAGSSSAASMSSATMGAGGTSGQGGAGGGSFGECGAYTPGDALAVCTATYLGGSGADRIAALDVAPDAAVVAGGTMSGIDFGLTPTTLMGGGNGVVLRFASTGRKVLSVTRLGARVDDLEVDHDKGRIAIVGDFGAALLSADASTLIWQKDLGGAASRVAIGSGVVAALRGKTLHVLDATTGAALGMFATSGAAINDIALDEAHQTVFVTGYKQDDEPSE